MSLEAGTTLGQYEILSSLGAGGMGEVCPERLARFEREARVLAALYHNNNGIEKRGSGEPWMQEELVGVRDRVLRV